MGTIGKAKASSFHWSVITGIACGLGWLALYTVLRLFGVQDPTAPAIVSTTAPAVILVEVWIISAIKQSSASKQLLWTWLMVYRKFAIAVVVGVSAILILLAAIAIDETIISGDVKMLVGLAVILAILGAILGGLLANFDFVRYRIFK